jgi:hypothetical protein
VIASVTLTFLVGCGNPAEVAVKKLFRPSPDKDVTTSPEYNFLSFSGTVWKTKGKTAVTDLKRYTGAHDISLLIPKYFDSSNPDYTSVHDMKMIVVLPPGSRIQIERLTKDNGAWGGLMVTGTVENGTNSFKNVRLNDLLLANNRFISRGPTTSTNWDVNPEFLEKP